MLQLYHPTVQYMWRILGENKFRNVFSMLRVCKTARCCDEPSGRVVIKKVVQHYGIHLTGLQPWNGECIRYCQNKEKCFI